MGDYYAESRKMQGIVTITIIILWSAALFSGWETKTFGVSLFRYTGLFLIYLFSMIFLLKPRIILFRGRGKYHKLVRALLLTYLVYVIVSLSGAIYSPRTSDAILYIAKQFWRYVLCTLTLFLTNYFQLSRKILVWIGIIAFSILFTLSYVFRVEVRFSVLSDSNIFFLSFLFSGLLILAGLDNLSKTKPYLHIIYVIILVISGIAGILVSSKRSLLCIAALLVMSFLLTFLKRLNKAANIIILTACAVICILIFSNLGRIPFVDKYARRYDFYVSQSFLILSRNYSYAMPRVEKWRRAMDIYETYTPLEMFMGKGTGAQLEFYSGIGEYPHNFVWSALLDGGIIKLSVIILWICLYWWTVFVIWHRLSYYGSLFLTGGFLIFLLYVSISSMGFFAINRIAFLLVVSLFLLPEREKQIVKM